MSNDLQILVKEFADSARAQGAAIEGGDPKKANRHSDNIFIIAEALQKRGEAGWDALGALLEDPDEHVVCWAAAYLLGSGLERKARKVLKSLAKSTKSAFVSIDAEMTLKEWDAGNLKHKWAKKLKQP